jgi:ubiquinone/menaquinone biosynthesis C-methylase UbiE
MIHDRERPSFEESNNVTVQRCFYAYEFAEEYIKGKRVADIGCGTGYGTVHMVQFAESAVGVDYSAETVAQNKKDNAHIENLEFITCTVPPIDLPSESFDVVTAFQFIEHLEDPMGFIKEAKRILKPGGVFLCTTVNAKMSLARNPFHVFEYTFDGMEADFRKVFDDVEMIGLQGNDRVNEYYKDNAKWVKSVLKWDIFGLHKILPGKLLALPYNFLTSKMRQNLMEKNDVTTDISTKDFFLQKDNLDKTWDIFVIAKK